MTTSFSKAGSIKNGVSRRVCVIPYALKVLQTEKRIGLLVANRLESYSRYGDAEVQLMGLLSPHICRAITISD